MLIGGEPGGGKSVGQSMLTATAALDLGSEPDLLDGKYVELASWVGCAACTVGPDQDQAITVLRELVREMDDRYLTLVANRQREIYQADGWKLHVIVCDELAFYLNTTDRNANKEAGNLMRDLVSRGRAAGVIFLAATQKPSGEDPDLPAGPVRLPVGVLAGTHPADERHHPRSGCRPPATPPLRSTPPIGAWATYCTRVASRCGCGPST